jgi:hypothetical protein
MSAPTGWGSATCDPDSLPQVDTICRFV